MRILVIFLHVVVCLALIIIVLLQKGKGAGIGALFGSGSSQTLFGSSGATSFLSKITVASAIIFMLTSLTLAFLFGRLPNRSIMQNVGSVPAQTQPIANQPVAPAAPVTNPEPAPDK